jgi:hypothetical protein
MGSASAPSTRTANASWYDHPKDAKGEKLGLKQAFEDWLATRKLPPELEAAFRRNYTFTPAGVEHMEMIGGVKEGGGRRRASQGRAREHPVSGGPSRARTCVQGFRPRSHRPSGGYPGRSLIQSLSSPSGAPAELQANEVFD